MKKLARLIAAGSFGCACPVLVLAAQEAAEGTVPASEQPAAGDKLYVSDDMSTWARSGPGPDYRVMGAVRVGDEVTFVQASSSGRYYQVQKEGSARMWVEAKQLVREPVGHSQVKILNEQIRTLEERLANYDNELAQELKATAARLERLQKENQGQAAAIVQKDETISELDEIRRSYMDKLETRELDMQMRWWVQGAVIALFGAAAGAALVYIPRPDNRRKFKNRF